MTTLRSVSDSTVYRTLLDKGNGGLSFCETVTHKSDVEEGNNLMWIGQALVAILLSSLLIGYA